MKASWVNLFVAFWFMLNEETFNEWENSTQLCFDIRLFGFQYKNGSLRYVTEDIAFKDHALGIDFDYHYITSDNQFFFEKEGEWYKITIDVGKLLKKAFDYFNIQKAKLMEIEIVLEGYYGYAEAEIDYIKVYTDPKPNSPYVLVNSVIVFALAFILLAFIVHLLKRTRLFPSSPTNKTYNNKVKLKQFCEAE